MDKKEQKVEDLLTIAQKRKVQSVIRSEINEYLRMEAKEVVRDG